MQQQENQRKVGFDDEGERRDDEEINRNPNNQKCPKFLNDQFLDPYAVKTSLKEEEAQQQEYQIVQFTISEGLTADELIQNLDQIMFRKRSNQNKQMYERNTTILIVPAVLSLRTKKVTNKLDRPQQIQYAQLMLLEYDWKENQYRQSYLRYLMKILGSEDGICIILLHLLEILKRKNLYQKKLFELKGLKSTNICDGMNIALWMIKNRKYKNPVSCIFLLSDGQDDYKGTEQRVLDQIELINIEEKFVIHTFGYGQDHDAYVMNQIAKYREGNFYYIDNINKVFLVRYYLELLTLNNINNNLYLFFIINYLMIIRLVIILSLQ